MNYMTVGGKTRSLGRPKEWKYEYWENYRQRWYWQLKSPNGRVVAMCGGGWEGGYSSKKGLLKILRRLRDGGYLAPIVLIKKDSE